MWYHLVTMSDADDILKRWRTKTTEASLEEVKKVIEKKIAGRNGVRIQENKGSSHVYTIFHIGFKFVSSFDGHDNFTIAHKGGKKVKGVYLKDIMAAIDALDVFEQVDADRERKGYK